MPPIQLPSMLPTILNHAQIQTFNFYHHGAVRRGMTVNGQLYKFVATFALEERLQAFERACQLSCQGEIVLTADIASGYHLWADICAQAIEPPP